MADIVLATHVARWIHTAFGLRCLRANLGELRERSELCEFLLTDRPADVVERILQRAPRIVGLGVYIWNAQPALEVVRTLKRVRPDVVVVIGGPEVSHECEAQAICALADHVVCGEGDVAFRELCRALLAGEPADRRIVAPAPSFAQLRLPYDEYDDEDIAHRVVYVEASRGCPFTCSFCLSALDDGVRKPELEPFLRALQRLLDRGVRHFKFVDRTFNLGIERARAVLRFFRERYVDGLFLHFELIPDRLPPALRDEIVAMPPGSLQFEVGVQTFDAATAERIARRQDPERVTANLRWLRTATDAHLHVDLIVGLPGESERQFAAGFDRLLTVAPHEIQVGVLKRLRGTPITGVGEAFGLVYAEQAPYEVLATAAVPFDRMQRLKRFARYWDLLNNRGNWLETLPMLLAGGSGFDRFLEFSDWLYARTSSMAGIALTRLAQLVWQWLVDERGMPADDVAARMLADYRRCGRSDLPPWLRDRDAREGVASASARGNPAISRQHRHRPTR